MLADCGGGMLCWHVGWHDRLRYSTLLCGVRAGSAVVLLLACKDV